MRSARSSLLVRLLVWYLLPTLVLFGLFGWLALREAERGLEQSLGQRLIGIAHAAATQIRPDVVQFLSPGDDGSRTAQRLRHKLKQLQQRTRVARILVLDPQLRSRADTRDNVKIGDRYYQAEADRAELRRLFQHGGEVSSVLFAGADNQLYKTGYAPVLDRTKAVAAVSVEGSAEYFSVLASLRRALLLAGAGVALLVMLVSVIVARRITRPLRTLAGEAARIGAGDLQRPIEATSHDEVGLLARTMNEMRQGLFERDTQMQMMLSGIAHEVRNPLGGIELFSGLLRDDLAGDPEKLEHVARIERELGHLKRVVGDFLDFARRPPPSLTRVDLSLLLDEIAELMTADASARGVRLVCVNAPTWAGADAEQLRRALINLVRNAIQATARDVNAQVVLRCGPGPRGETVFCEVADRGGGITPEAQQQIFKPFFTTREQGTGLGLAFVKKIVEQHDGALELTSEPGQGSTFRVTLRAAQKAE